MFNLVGGGGRSYAKMEGKMIDLPSSEQIAAAKIRVVYSMGNYDVLHVSDDCVRIAYAWLDAQIKIKRPRKRNGTPWKHIIEDWGGRYVPRSDVELAAELHPDIIGVYPRFNISERLVRPANHRLDGIAEARVRNQRDGMYDNPPRHWWKETDDGKLERLRPS